MEINVFLGSIILIFTLTLVGLVKYFYYSEENNNFIIPHSSPFNRSASDLLLELARKNHPQFLPFFLEMYPDFVDKFKLLDPNIRNSELCFLAYLYLNFSTKEIANYTYISEKAVLMRKNRLRKKYNIESSIPFNRWIEFIVDENFN